MNRNEAYAFARCEGCAAVAVGFQVVLVSGDNHVAAPVNIAAAVNYDCVNCLTYALAVQLFVTIDEPLDEATMRRLDELWREIAAYGANIGSVPLDEIQGKLEEFENEILATLGVADPEATTPPSPGTSAPADDSASPSVPPEATPSEPTATPAEEPAAEETPSTSPTPESDASEAETTESDADDPDSEASPQP
jgi:putative peptide zinc metalloprotease protein